MSDKCPTCDREEAGADSIGDGKCEVRVSFDSRRRRAGEWNRDANRDCNAHAVDWRAEALRLRTELAKAREVPAGVEEAIGRVVRVATRDGMAIDASNVLGSKPSVTTNEATVDLRTAIANALTAAEQRGREAGMKEAMERFHAEVLPAVDRDVAEAEARGRDAGRAEVLAQAPEVEAAIMDARTAATRAALDPMSADRERAYATARDALRNAVAYAVGAADRRGRAAGREDALAQELDVESSIKALEADTFEHGQHRGTPRGLDLACAREFKRNELRAAIAAVQARAVEAARQGMRAAVDKATAKQLIRACVESLSDDDPDVYTMTHAALISALTGKATP